MILLGRRHPTPLTLSRFADGDLPPGLHQRIGRHVGRCSECGEYVRFVHELGAVARKLDRPAVTAMTGEGVRRRRIDRTPADRRRFAELVAAGVALVVVMGGYLLFAPSVSATRGKLSFGALESPAIGAEGVDEADDARGAVSAVPVSYSPAYYLADEDSLRLRAEVTRPGDGGSPRRTVREVTLRKVRGGGFTGRLRLEPGDVFTLAAVEEFGGAEIDTNSGRLWELYPARAEGAEGAEGKESAEGGPGLVALEAHYRALEAYNWVLAVDWADSVARERPDDLFARVARLWSLAAGGRAGPPDSVLEVERARLGTLLRRHGESPEPEALRWLAAYARQLGEPALHDSLLDELARVAPRHPAVIDRQVAQAVAEHGIGTPALLDRLDELWRASDGGTPLLVHMGVQTAASAGREPAFDAWIERGLRHPAVDPENLLDDVTPFDPNGSRRILILRARLAALEAREADPRPLRLTAAAFESRRRAELVRLRIALARALSDAGDDGAAAELYRATVDEAWRPEDVRPRVDFLLARGDTAAALPGIGMLIADPVGGDSALVAYGAVVAAAGERAATLAAAGRAELRKRAFAALPVGRKLRHETRLGSPDGDEFTAGDYFSGAPTVLLLWDPQLTPGSRWLTAFKALAAAEAARGGEVRTAIVVPPAASEDLEALATGGLPVVVDRDLDLVAQLGVPAVPSLVAVGGGLEAVIDPPDAAAAFRVARLLVR